MDDEERDDEGHYPLLLFDRDLEDAERILIRIVRARQHRTIHPDEDVAFGLETLNEVEASEKLARQMFAAQEARVASLPKCLRGEAAWSLLITLFLASKSGTRRTVNRLIDLSGCSTGTAIRYIDVLEREGLVYREGDERDKRISFILISSKGLQAVQKILVQALRA